MSRSAATVAGPPGRRSFVAPSRWSVAAQLLTLVLATTLLLVALGVAAAYWLASNAAHHEASERALGVARTVAAAPSVIDQVSSGQSTTLQAYAERVRRATDTDFVVIMNRDGVRYTHPDPAQIGKQFRGHIAAAVAGGVVLEDYVGTLGESVRSVVPVVSDGRVVGLVSVGIKQSAVGDRVRDQIPPILLAASGFAALTGLAAWALARRVRRQTRGMDAQQLRDMYEYYDAVLHAVTEGLVIVDDDRRLRICNDQARRLLVLPEDAVGKPLDQLPVPDSLAAALVDDAGRRDEQFVTEERVLVVNQAAAEWNGRHVGYVTTLRDRTDLESLTGELDSARGLTEALRSQAHESANRLHTMVSLVELGETEQALAFATEELRLSQQLTDRVVAAVEEPALTALLLGKAADAAERGITMVISPDAHVPRGLAPQRDLVTIVGNLLDNALDAVGNDQLPSRQVGFDATVEGDHAVIEVWDNGHGLPEGAEQLVFQRGWSTKADGAAGRRGIGLALVAQTVRRLGGTLEVDGPPGARFTVSLPITARVAVP